ncbi:MAG TPA: hypothetical protein VM791_13745 [Vicinamibacterales bacterium]|jgi:hypothetical protein|nr:hypothetical protein [Vicinamibacterales bacterium]
MVVIGIIGLLAVATGMLYSFFRRREERRFWQTALLIGISIGVVRALLASLGWYTVEHTGGPRQVPGFVLAMSALPEAALLPHSRVSAAPPVFYVQMSALLIGSSAVVVALVAAVARMGRK